MKMIGLESLRMKISLSVPFIGGLPLTVMSRHWSCDVVTLELCSK